MTDFKEKGTALDPFLKGREEHFSYVERILDSANTFKKIAVGATLVALVSSISAGYLATRSEYIPFIIRADKVTGYTDAVGPVTKQEYKPTEAETKYFLTDFIKKVRTVPLDPVVYQKNWKDAQIFLTEGAAKKLNAISESQGHFSKLGSSTVEPTVLGITRLSNSDNTYQIRWQEVDYGINSGQSTQQNYIGTFTIKSGELGTEADLYKNPLGIKITDISFSLENAAQNTEPAKKANTAQQNQKAGDK